MPLVLCGLPRDQYQRSRRLADVAAFVGDRRALHLSEVHGVLDVLSGRRIHCRGGYRQIARSPTAGSLDREAKVAAITLNDWNDLNGVLYATHS